MVNFPFNWKFNNFERTLVGFDIRIERYYVAIVKTFL